MQLCQNMARNAGRELDTEFLDGGFELAHLREPVDAVCAFQVLEYAEDPHAFLVAAMRVLRPEGILVLEVPNVDAAAAVRLGGLWPPLQTRSRRWHFTRASLTRLLTMHGLRILRQDTIAPRSYLPFWYRTRHVRQYLVPDLLDLGSARLSHPSRAELIRVIAQRDGLDQAGTEIPTPPRVCSP
jgi:SAM-dependent methyltransferase